jgi:hypothetical protein
VALRFSDVRLVQGGFALPRRFVGTGDAVFPVTGAYRMAVLSTPPGDQPVAVYMYLAGGQVCEGDRCSEVEPCGAPLITTFDPAKVRADNCHVVVELDLARSIQAGPRGLATLLQYRLHY